MTRRPADRHPRRLLRMRPTLQRPEHGLDLALPRVLGDDEPRRSADTRALRALAEENAMLARELGRVQARCTRWRDDCIAQADRLEAQLMRARARILAQVTELAIARDQLGARPPVVQPPASRSVLCVGGRARQVPIYRELVERTGARFTHVDGSSADGLATLRQALAHADLVILQPAYASQETCRAVETHCARHGVRCVQLEKTCVPGFLQGLQQAASAN